MSKKSKIWLIVGIIIVVLLAAGIAAYTVMASNHNKRVDALASEIDENLSELTMDLTQDSIDSPTAFKYLVELSLLDNGEGVNEEALTYFDGSKAKYNEVNDNIDATIDAYQNYFKNKNENVLTQTAIDIAAATKDEISAAISGLQQLINDIDTQNAAAKIVNSEYGIIFGDDEETAKAYFDDLKARINNKLSELQAKLDEINASEAAAAAQAAASASSSSTSSSSSKSASSSNYSNSGGNSSNNNNAATAERLQEANIKYGNYVRAELAAGRTPMSWTDWCAANGY